MHVSKRNNANFTRDGNVAHDHKGFAAA